MLIDTHCHLDLPPLVSRLDELLEQARAVGVSRWVVPGVAPEGWSGIDGLCRVVAGALPAYGIHPAHAAACGDEQLALLEEYAGQAVAIGEVGLDCEADDPAAQERLFREQIRLARRHGLPLLLHCRGRIGRLLTILREERADQVGGIMHAFAGSVQSARDAVRLGFAISLSGTLTWQGAQRPGRLARELPLACLVVESDAPDQAPQNHRGLANQPAWIVEQVGALAEIRQMPSAELLPVLAANARRFLRLG